MHPGSAPPNYFSLFQDKTAGYSVASVRFALNKFGRTVALPLLLSLAFSEGILRAEEQSSRLGGVDSWAGRPALPALVNPVVSSRLQSVLSLRGQWEFVTQEIAPLRHPTWRAFYSKPWPQSRAIQVPGCWEAQGVGTPGIGNAWDTRWDNCAKPLRWIYMGDAWYRKTATIPPSWKGQRIWLKVGGVRSQGWFWVSQTKVAWVDNYCGTY